jgi:hypothetical protein
MNSQIDMMVLAVEGCRGPPVRQGKAVLSCQAIIKFIIWAAIIRGIKNENDGQIKVPDDIYTTAAIQRKRPGAAVTKIKYKI